MEAETAVRIPRKAREILRKKSFAHVATVMPRRLPAGDARPGGRRG